MHLSGFAFAESPCAFVLSHQHHLPSNIVQLLLSPHPFITQKPCALLFCLYSKDRSRTRQFRRSEMPMKPMAPKDLKLAKIRYLKNSKLKARNMNMAFHLQRVHRILQFPHRPRQPLKLHRQQNQRFLLQRTRFLSMVLNSPIPHRLPTPALFVREFLKARPSI